MGSGDSVQKYVTKVEGAMKDVYAQMLPLMSETELFMETKMAITNSAKADAMAIQLCKNEWDRRGQSEKFLAAYNASIRT